MYLYFIDYEKAFNRIKHTEMIWMPQNMGLDENDTRFITHLYWNQLATIRVNSRETEEIRIKRGARQGCVFFSLLFNLNSEHIIQKALKNAPDGAKVNGNNLRYADYTVIIADGLQRLMNDILRTPGVETNIRVYDQLIERVIQIEYLECWITHDPNPEVEIRVRIEIEMARAAFLKMR